MSTFRDFVHEISGGDKMDISEMTVGVSASGMGEYRGTLQMELLTKTADDLNTAYDTIKTSVDMAWQGASAEKFKNDLRNMIDAIIEDLGHEYQDLDSRLKELEQFYYDQDRMLAEE